MIENELLKRWVEEVSNKTKPDQIKWCDGSEDEYQYLINLMIKNGTLIELNQAKYPGCYLHRSNKGDVARTENSTFVCTINEEDAGPTNNWMSPDEADKKVGNLFNGSMEGKTMYIVPYLLGPIGSPFSQSGVEITDSPYVAANIRIMTRMGNVALENLKDSEDFVRGLHSTGDLNPENRYICHFPEKRLIISFASNYGGNALLNKKCHSLRIASAAAKDEKWLAEHMLIIGVEDPNGKMTYLTGAFPSACGKTNLAMLNPPNSYKNWKVWTMGDDIAWLNPSSDGNLYAINPESGFFGIAPGTNMDTNPNAMATIKKNTLFTNVVETSEGTPWWEDMDDSPPVKALDWLGNEWVPGTGKGAHPNSRFTAPISQCPSLLPSWEDPNGVPISAIILGGRRAKLAPLVYEAFDWNHGVFIGSMMGSETTAAAVGDVGIVRRDPMAMLPFCGYNMADYFQHWLNIGTHISHPPRIFHVNWFRKDENGKFIWPGFGENIRVLKWIIDRVNGVGEAVKTPIGYIPSMNTFDIDGLDLSDQDVKELFEINSNNWSEELDSTDKFFKKFGDRLPEEMWSQHSNLKSRLKE